MKKTTITLLNTLIFGLALFVGMHAADAAKVWINPSASPTAGNMSIPLHAGAGAQVKSGGLALNTFLATKNAQFNQQVFFRKPIHGGTPSVPATLRIGGDSASGAVKFVNTLVSAKTVAQGTLGAAELSNTSTQKLCASSDGHIVLCSQSQPPAVPLDSVRFTFVRNPSIASGDYYATKSDACDARGVGFDVATVYMPASGVDANGMINGSIQNLYTDSATTIPYVDSAQSGFIGFRVLRSKDSGEYQAVGYESFGSGVLVYPQQCQ